MPEQKQITIVVALIVNDKGEILLGRRNQPDIPAEHDKWEFPGGGIQFGEDPETALLREVREETGAEVEIVRLLPKVINHVWEGQNRQIILLNYECKLLGGDIKPGDPEISELKFINIKDVGNYQTLPNVKETIALLNS